MSQTYTINCYQADHVGQTDLANMENNFESLRSTFSGAAAPANAIAGKMWFDTAQNLLKVRNDANNAWLGVLTGTTSLKMLVYRNTAEDGWAIDSGITDRVVAIKGGATYTTGGATAGSWTLPSHALTVSEMPSHNHTPGAVSNGAHTHTLTLMDIVVSSAGYHGWRKVDSGSHAETTSSDGAHTHTVTAQGDGDSHNHGATYRPAAAVVTLQYPDI